MALSRAVSLSEALHDLRQCSVEAHLAPATNLVPHGLEQVSVFREACRRRGGHTSSEMCSPIPLHRGKDAPQQEAPSHVQTLHHLLVQTFCANSATWIQFALGLKNMPSRDNLRSVHDVVRACTVDVVFTDTHVEHIATQRISLSVSWASLCSQSAVLY